MHLESSLQMTINSPFAYISPSSIFKREKPGIQKPEILASEFCPISGD